MRLLSTGKVLLRHIIATCIFISSAFLFCCREEYRQNYDPRLSEIEEIVRKHPADAQSELEQLDISDFRRRRDKAKYALLYTRACHNNNTCCPDSLMHFAEAYFMKHGTDTEKAQILYCLGNSFSRRDSFASAASYYSKAVIFAQNSGDSLQIAAIHNALGYSYRFQMDYEEALNHFSQSGELLKQAGWIGQYLIPKYQQIGILNKLGRSDEALAAVLEANSVALKIADTAMILRLASLEAAIAAEQNPDSEKAAVISARLTEIYRKYNSGVIPKSHYNTLGLIYFYRNKLDSARYYLTQSLKFALPINTRLGVYYTMARLAEQENRPAEALRYEQSVTSLQDTLFNETKDAMIQTAERKYRNEYLQAQYDLLALKHRYRMVFMTMAIFAIIGLVGCLFWFFRKHMKDQKKRMEEAMSYVDSVQLGYSEVNGKYESLKSNFHLLNKDFDEMVRLLEKRMGSLKQLLEIASVYESRPTLFYAKFKEYIKVRPQMDTQWEEDMVAITNRFCNNLIEELRSAHPSLSVHELCYCSLICLGFTQQSIRVLYDHTNMNSVYSLRTRIRSKLGISSSYSLDNHIRELLIKRNIAGFPIIR